MDNDFCTLVSILPLPIEEIKPSVHPGRYILDANRDGDFSIIVVGVEIAYMYLDQFRGQYPIRYPSEQIAQSVINDLMEGHLFTSPEAGPGVFYVKGKFDKETILLSMEFKSKMEVARARQFKWFEKLVARADDSWKKNGQQKLITDLERSAARTLKIKRDWVAQFSPTDMTNCPGCGEIVNSRFAFCKSCKTVINIEAARNLMTMDDFKASKVLDMAIAKVEEVKLPPIEKEKK